MHGVTKYFLESSFILQSVVCKFEIYMELHKSFYLNYTVLRMQGKNYTIFLAFIIGSGSVTEFYNFLDVCVTSMDNTGKINIFLIPSEKIK